MLSALLPHPAYQTFVLLVTMAILAIGGWGASGIRQKFDPFLLIPQDSYLANFIRVNDEFYTPYDGWHAEVYTGPLVASDLPALDTVVRRLEDLLGGDLEELNSWWINFSEWTLDELGVSATSFTSSSNFSTALTDFLHSIRGARFRTDFQFAGELDCGGSAPPVTASKFYIKYRRFSGPEEHVPARASVEDVLRESGLSTAFSFVKVSSALPLLLVQVYAAWETDQIISQELWRNILLALVCVTIVVLMLLANFRICLLVILAIVFTLTDIVGFLHFWDITIDIVSCINIVLAIGLCVDYSVHICHAFLVAQGSRAERAITAVDTIGPAVVNGGVTTFLALVLLAGSTSHTFITFFKVFLLTVTFGLFHGLILLPVLLLLVGPKNQEEHEEQREVQGESNPGFLEEEKSGVFSNAWAHLFPKRRSWSPTSPEAPSPSPGQAQAP